MSYQTTVINDAPSGYWRLGESSGNPADSSGNGKNATAAAGVTYSTAGALLNDVDTALTFNGTTGKITLPSMNLGAGTAASIEAWVSFSGSSSELFVYSEGSTVSANPIFGMAVCISAGGALPINVIGGIEGYYRGVGGAIVKVCSTIAVNDSKYHHVVFTFNKSDTTSGANGTANIFLDGLFNARAALPNDTPSCNLTSIGCLSRSADGSFWSGIADEVAVYSYALTAQQVTSHYQAGGRNAATSMNNYQQVKVGDGMSVGEKIR